MIRECDKRARNVRELISNENSITNITFYGSYNVTRAGEMQSKAVNEVVRIVDAREEESKHVEKKYGHKKEFIDIEARNAFKIGKVTPSMMKCAHGYNHYGVREAMINNNMVDSMCPRCEQVETWDHVIKCKETRRLRKDFVEDLLITLVKK